MKLFLTSFFGLFLFSQIGLTQDITNIPDPNFEQALIDLNIDSDGIVNNEVLTDDINAITNLNIFNYDIKDLTGIEAFDSLEILNCSNNQLSTIDLSQNKKLIKLNISSNLLSALNISADTLITELNCQYNLLTTLDVQLNKQLKTVDFSSNQISDINLSENDSLIRLKCSNNRLTTLDIVENIKLTELMCSSNQIGALAVDVNKMIETLFCSSNQIDSLDLRQNTSLRMLDCSNNQLKSLEINSNLDLQQLTCLANQLKKLDVGDLDSLKFLACSNNQLEGLELDSNLVLQQLICASNLLTDINVDANIELQTIDFSYNLIQSADFSENDTLTYLNCAGNRLKYLNVKNGQNSILSIFNAADNPELTCIAIDDVSEVGDAWIKDITATYSVNCYPIYTNIPDNNFEQALINLGLDTELPDGKVVTDSIHSLKTLNIPSKSIVDLTGIHDFVALEILNCSNNMIDSLVLIANKSLSNIDCSSNNLTFLNIKNHNNGNLMLFDARGNTLLSCISVDDESQPGAGWKPGVASYSNNCKTGFTFIPDDHFEQKLIEMKLDLVLDNYVVTESIDTIRVLDIDSLFISDLTGIEDFISLDSLDCSANQLYDLDVSSNDSLQHLVCFSNYLYILNVTSNDSLKTLKCGNNRLTMLDVRQNKKLEELIVDSNFLIEIDVSQNNKLLRLNLNSNNITSSGLDLSALKSLEELRCSNNKLSSLDIRLDSSLIELECSQNYLASIDLSANIFLEQLDCSMNYLETLDVRLNTKLDTINCNTNQLQSMDFSLNPSLRMLSCEDNFLTNLTISANDTLLTLLASNNRFSSINVTNNEMLNIFHCNNNELTTLDINKNLKLLQLSCSGNLLSDIDISNNTFLAGLNCEGNQLTNINLSNNPVLLSLAISRNEIDSLYTKSNVVLSSLKCDDNNLSDLILKDNHLLKIVSCPGNEIKHLDLSIHDQLNSLVCAGNRLNTLIISNGNNDSLEIFNALNNPELLCIEVDDINNIGESWLKDEQAAYSENCHFFDTYIPDDSLEVALAIITGEPNNNDDYISTASINALISLDISNKGIKDLTGIEDFDALKNLNVSGNQFDTLSFPQNPDLSEINCSGSGLQYLDLSENKALKTINISSNQLVSIDLSKQAMLNEFLGDNNLFTELTFNYNPSLTSVTCKNNKLESLKLKNGNNPDLLDLNVTGNPNLTCIEVDDESQIGSAWLVDATASFSENCHYNETYIADTAFEQALIDQDYDYSPNAPIDNYVPSSKIKAIGTLDISNEGITSLTGIEEFDALMNLDCSNNQLSGFDYNLPQLTSLNCSRNVIEQIELSTYPKLTNLNVSDNNLSEIDVSGNRSLTHLDCSGNLLEAFNITQNPNLKQVDASYNLLFSVNANNGKNSDLIELDFRNNPNLTCILIDNPDDANGNVGWYKDDIAQYRLVCDDDDNDGVFDVDDNCPFTAFGYEVDLFGCSILILPHDNFTIHTTSETCRGANNGMININAEEILTYTATLKGDNKLITHNFTNSLEIRNLKADTYLLCITVAAYEDFELCYTLQITEPEDLKVFSTGSILGGRIAYAMEGGHRYWIVFNGNRLSTTDNNISLELLHGKNTIKVMTDQLCQGIFEETIYYSRDIITFPNPAENILHIAGDFQKEEIIISIYSSQGELMNTENRSVYQGKIDIDISVLTSGLYIVNVQTENEFSAFKVTKR